MMSLWDALRMNMMISYQELVRTFPNIRHGVMGCVHNEALMGTGCLRTSGNRCNIF